MQGIDIELNEDGSWKAIYAIGVQAVTFPDRRGINNAYVIAEERAKAEIARYFEQNVTTGRIYTEAEETLEQTMRIRGTGNDSLTARASRTLMTSLQETFASSASAILRGVTILERSYDEKREEVTVKVGISRETIATAGEVQQGMRQAAAGGRVDDVVRVQSESRTRALPTGPGTDAFRPFFEARGFVRALGLRSRVEWDAYVKSGEKPANIPADPETAYRGNWISWDDWLGISR